MIVAIEGMPAGTLGFRATGRITGEDYTGVVLPALEAALEEGSGLRTLHQLGPDLEEFDPRTLWREVKGAGTLGIEDLNRLERTALSTDAEWIRRSAPMFSWLVPGEFRLFALGEVEAARSWLAR